MPTDREGGEEPRRGRAANQAWAAGGGAGPRRGQLPGGRATPKTLGQRRGSHAGRRCGGGGDSVRGIGSGFGAVLEGQPRDQQRQSGVTPGGEKDETRTQTGPRTLWTRAGRGCSEASVDRRIRSAQEQSLFAKGKGLRGVLEENCRQEGTGGTDPEGRRLEESAEQPLCLGWDLERP